MRFIITLTLAIAAVTASPDAHQRIVGGSLTTINQYPTIVALLFAANGVTFRQSCGGSILNNRSILSAAHCPIGDAASRWRVRLGSTWASSGGTVLNFASYILHPNYNRWTFDNDIVVMRTSSNINYSNVIQPARIAGSNYNLADNQVVWAAGWGAIYNGGPTSEQLRHVQIWTVNLATCRSRYASINMQITDNMLCSGWLDVGGRDQCQQDSGGPLYHNGVVVGVSSFGAGCGDPRFPGVNARVSRYTSWIQSNS